MKSRETRLLLAPLPPLNAAASASGAPSLICLPHHSSRRQAAAVVAPECVHWRVLPVPGLSAQCHRLTISLIINKTRFDSGQIVDVGAHDHLEPLHFDAAVLQPRPVSSLSPPRPVSGGGGGGGDGDVPSSRPRGGGACVGSRATFLVACANIQCQRTTSVIRRCYAISLLARARAHSGLAPGTFGQD